MPVNLIPETVDLNSPDQIWRYLIGCSMERDLGAALPQIMYAFGSLDVRAATVFEQAEKAAEMLQDRGQYEDARGFMEQVARLTTPPSAHAAIAGALTRNPEPGDDEFDWNIHTASQPQQPSL